MYQHYTHTDESYRAEPTLIAAVVAAALPLVALLAVAYPAAAVGVLAGFALASAYARL
jgi:hypothetical protein